MATQEDVDTWIALVTAGQFDAARALSIQGWDELFMATMASVALRGGSPKFLEDLGISESWNLQNEDPSLFGAGRTHLYGIPLVDGAAVILPVTGLFAPDRGYVWHIRNGSQTERLTVDPQGGATIDGAPSYDVEPMGSVELSYDGVGPEFVPIGGQIETSYDAAPPTEGTFVGGTGHAASDVVTLSDGSAVTVDAESAGVVTQFTVDATGSTGAADGDTLTQTATTGSGTGFALTVGVDNLEAGRSLSIVASSSVERSIRIPLAELDTAAGLLSWQNAFGAPVLVSLILDVTTQAAGALTADFGQASTSVLSNNLADGVDLGGAAGVFSSHEDQGANGRTYRRVLPDEFVTGSMATGSAAGLIGAAFISYRFSPTVVVE